MPELLTRDRFRERIFERDGHKCVVCGASEGLDAHHLIERRLWPDGGYYEANGAALCPQHHREAEATVLSCQHLRQLAGIREIVLPPHLYADAVYDKWGDEILANGQRLRGELFDDESVQKVLAPILYLFTSRVKYPRTFHLPWSPGMTDDDRMVGDADALFKGREVVVTAKMDGENSTLYTDGLHARSLDYTPHPSRNRLRALHASIAHDIPKGFRICGENLYAKHAIHYHKLPAHFLVFSVWNERNVCLSWDETQTWAALLGLRPVPVLYRGLWDEAKVKVCYQPTIDGEECEGYVVRDAGTFHYREFRTHVAKYVRAGHVVEHGHWMARAVVPNEVGE